MGSLPKLCKYTWRWNSSANFLLVHWEWSSNEVYFMLTFCNGAFLSWMTHICTAAQHVFDLWIMLYFKTFYPVRITTVSHEPDWCNTFNSKAWLKPVYEAQNHIHQFNSCVSYTLFFLVMVALIVALKCVFFHRGLVTAPQWGCCGEHPSPSNRLLSSLSIRNHRVTPR